MGLLGRWRSLRLEAREVPCRGREGRKGMEKVVGKAADEPYSTIRKGRGDFLAHRTGIDQLHNALDSLLHRLECDDD